MLTPADFPEESDPARTLAFALGFIAAGLLGLALTRLLVPSAEVTGEGSGAKVGFVKRTRGGVRVRPGSAVLWRDFSREKLLVHEGDLIFTDSEGEAHLELLNGVSAEILPDTLIVVRLAAPLRPQTGAMSDLLSRLASKEPMLDLNAGRMNLKFSQQAMVGIEGDTQGQTFLSGGTDASLVASRDSGDPGEVRLAVGSGSGKEHSTITVARNGKPSSTLEPGEVLSLTAESHLKQEADLASQFEPKDGSVVYALSSEQVRFSWNWKRSFLTPTDLIYLNIEGPVSKLEKLELEGTELKLDLPPGKYRWRLEVVRGQFIHRIPKASFTVRRLQAPQLLGPADGSWLASAGGGGTPVQLTFHPLAQGFSAQIEVIEEGPQETPRLLDAGRQGVGLPLPPGHYRWRAKTIAGVSRESPWTGFFRFSIGTGSNRKAPQFAPVGPPRPPESLR